MCCLYIVASWKTRYVPIWRHQSARIELCGSCVCPQARYSLKLTDKKLLQSKLKGNISTWQERFQTRSKMDIKIIKEAYHSRRHERETLLFHGILKKVRIVSNHICYGPMPEPDEEVEQHLTINNEGRVWFSGYNFGTAADTKGHGAETSKSKRWIRIGCLVRLHLISAMSTTRFLLRILAAG